MKSRSTEEKKLINFEYDDKDREIVSPRRRSYGSLTTLLEESHDKARNGDPQHKTRRPHKV